MKKSDLVSGKHIVEINNKRRYLVAGNYLPNIDGSGWFELSDFNDDLQHSSYVRETVKSFNINKVYEIVIPMGLCDLIEKMDTACKLVWERKPELSEAERVILENVDKEYKWMAKDATGEIYLYKEKPVKSRGVWLLGINKTASMHQFNDLFKMIDADAWEPTLIADLLDKDEPFRWPE